MNVYFAILIIGFIIGTLVSINALYVLLKFFSYVRFRNEVKNKKIEYFKGKDNFKNEFDIKIDD